MTTENIVWYIKVNNLDSLSKYVVWSFEKYPNYLRYPIKLTSSFGKGLRET